ncbi:MAG: tetratricopeptide repeat protein [Actinomycetota bacterium]|nr:tetratricopeptide repeat protein [Actinomycetota bacterium]
MTQQPFSTSALRGAVDLSALRRPAPSSAGGVGARGERAAGAGQTPGGAGSLVVEGTDAGFQEIATDSMRVPSVVLLWSARLPESEQFVTTLAGVVETYAGRLQLVSVDVDANPGLLRAFQVQSVPAAFGLVQGQPVPLFAGLLTPQEITPWLDELLKLALQQGVTGRVDLAAQQPGGPEGPAGAEGSEPQEDEEQPLPPHVQAAYDAIDAGDLDAAVAAYEGALKSDPTDAEAALGLAQVRLMQRTEGVDPVQARAAAAAAPTDLDAQVLVADLDVLGGHVEDAFSRLIDLVRVSAGDDRNRVRQHLIELFEIVGPGDERVERARKALMSALF